MPTAEALKAQGIQQFTRELYDQAADTFRQALAAYEQENSPDMAAEMRVNLGLTLHLLGQHQEALDQMEQARAVFAAAGDTLRTAQALGNMARVYAKLGNTEQAITYYREASAMFMELGDEENYGQTVLAIADLQLRSGNVMQAAATYEIGLDYIRQPTARQKIIKGLTGLRNRVIGTGGKPAGDE